MRFRAWKSPGYRYIDPDYLYGRHQWHWMGASGFLQIGQFNFHVQLSGTRHSVSWWVMYEGRKR